MRALSAPECADKLQWPSEERQVFFEHAQHPAWSQVSVWAWVTPMLVRLMHAWSVWKFPERVSRCLSLSLTHSSLSGAFYKQLSKLIALGYRIKQNLDYGTELALGNSVMLMGSAVPRIIKTGGRAPVPLALGATGVLATWYYQQKVREFRYGV